MIPERLVRFRARTVLAVLGIVLAVAIVLQLVWLAREVIAWMLIALFLALALNPAVDWLMRNGVKRRGYAVAIAFFAALLALAALAALFVPTLVREIDDFRQAVPGYVEDITEGRGPLGRFAEKYDLVDRVQQAVSEGGAAKVLGASGVALAIAKSVVSAIVATVTILFMTFFMLLEGPAWMERLYSLLPDQARPRAERVGRDIYRTIGGYVTGNLLISIIAGAASTIVLLVLGVQYAVALGVVVALLDLIPLAGATLAAIIVSSVAFIHSIPAGIIVVVFFIAYQQLENHLLQPIVYSRTVQLSPLAILISVLIGAKLAGILGALAAIPVAGTIQVLLLEWLQYRNEREATAVEPEPL